MNDVLAMPRTLLLVLAAVVLVACAKQVHEAAVKDDLEDAHTQLEKARVAHVEDYAGPLLHDAQAKYQQALRATSPQEQRDLAHEASVLAELATAQSLNIRAQANRASVMRQLGMPEPAISTTESEPASTPLPAASASAPGPAVEAPGPAAAAPATSAPSSTTMPAEADS